eukprot:GGOE01063260.1.p1 GENE.GGOE01063260.1~~GGOE01063260.1.p1  ORF type:complete len:200 (-),score=50.18 GGOE01063260.1:518-1039(-)
MAQTAIELLNGLSLEGSTLSVIMAERNKDKGIRNAPSPRLYVANLPVFYTEQDMLCLFSPFGPVQWLKLVRHRYSGASKGAALIHYTTLGSALAAKEAMHHHPMENGMLLDVTFAESAEERIARKTRTSVSTSRHPPCSPASLASSSSTDPFEARCPSTPVTPSEPPRRRWSA